MKIKKRLKKLRKEKKKLVKTSKKIKTSPSLEIKKEKKKLVKTEKKIKQPRHLKIKKVKKEKKSKHQKKKSLAVFMEKADIKLETKDINKRIIYFTLVLIGVSTIYLIYSFVLNNTFVSDAFGFLLPLWVFGSLILFLLSWLIYLIYIDLRIHKRRKEVEEVFPDFLQLTAANINAGMPVDQALWYAIRPRFGILAKEMESIAKATMIGEKLPVALINFSEKYDSIRIKRALNLLLEGLDSGSELGDLLNRVASNMRETDIIRKEMASNVTTYVIFILFATIGAAPFLFGLTTELIVIMNSIFSNINVGSSGQSFGGLGSMLSGSGQAISLKDYQIFAATSLFISSTFAAIIISVIQKGNAKEAIKKIPGYVMMSLMIYYAAFKLLHILLGGFFA